MQTILKLNPIFKEKIWGGNRLQTMFGYSIPSNKTGECWAISAHENGDNIIENGEFKGRKLSEIYKNYRYLFSNIKSNTFPLLSKIIDATDDLSVQVHPNNDQALKYNEPLGKTECWYILSAEENSEIIYGHTAQSEASFRNMIETGKWNKLLKRVPVKSGDFFYVPAGTLHAIGKGITILETQQSSDTTFRVYDYDRVDNQGCPRDLHIESSIEVTTIPHKVPNVTPVKTSGPGYEQKKLIEAEYFTVSLFNIQTVLSLKNSTFSLVNVIEGEVTINNQMFKKGDHLIVTSIEDKIQIQGMCTLIIATPGPEILND